MDFGFEDVNMRERGEGAMFEIKNVMASTGDYSYFGLYSCGFYQIGAKVSPIA